MTYEQWLALAEHVAAVEGDVGLEDVLSSFLDDAAGLTLMLPLVGASVEDMYIAYRDMAVKFAIESGYAEEATVGEVPLLDTDPFL